MSEGEGTPIQKQENIQMKTSRHFVMLIGWVQGKHFFKGQDFILSNNQRIRNSSGNFGT